MRNEATDAVSYHTLRFPNVGILPSTIFVLQKYNTRQNILLKILTTTTKFLPITAFLRGQILLYPFQELSTLTS